jgi:MFS family permease
MDNLEGPVAIWCLGLFHVDGIRYVRFRPRRRATNSCDGPFPPSLSQILTSNPRGIHVCTNFQPAFQQKFGIPYPSQPSGYLLPAVWQSAWIGAMFGALGAGELFAGGIMNRIGRKHILVIGNVITTIGIGVLQASGDWKMWLGGKILNAFGIGMIFTFSPVW